METKWTLEESPDIMSVNTLAISFEENENPRILIQDSTIVIMSNAVRLLIQAFNNRTREKNYFQKYCEFLSGEITEEAFEKDIRENVSKYVVSKGEDMSQEDIFTASHLATRLLGMENPEDFQAVFAISDKSILKCLK